MEFSELQIPPPKYWQKFEDLCLGIFRHVWGDPTAQKNGRSGQLQNGTDIWGTVGGAFVGVQCKGKDSSLGATLAEQELRDEIVKAKSFEPRLSKWTLATTAPKDARIEEVARQITVEHQADGSFEVQVLGWEDIVSLISQYPAIIEQHYPDLAPATQIALARISQALATPSPDLTEAIRLTREAAARDLEKFQRAEGGLGNVRLNLEKADKEKRLPISHTDVLVGLRSGQLSLLEAEPGAGKSTTLIQLAASVLSESDDCAVAILPLPELGDTRRDPIEEIASRDAFSNIGKDTLSHIARAGRLVVLCDGWNELPSAQREPVRISLTKFRREFSGSGLLVATRALSPSPIHEPTRIFLLPPSRAQQLAIFSETLGPGAEEILAKARRMPGLSDLLRTPLYVAVLADIGTGRTLPATKEEAIRRFIQNQERRQEHSRFLRDELHDRHDEYLRATAQLLTAMGAGAITQSHLRGEIAQVSERLKAAGQIATLPEPQRVIDVLVSHHVLVERPGAAARPFYSFQHQQFREWFASFYVEERVLAASATPSPENLQLLAKILNQTDWTESIFFSVERLSRASPEGARSVGSAILRAITIDPMLAAAMIRRASTGTWPLIAKPVLRFALEWYKTEESHRAFRFMTGSGRPEFDEPVWETIKSDQRYDRSANFDFGWFAPSVLGPNGRTEYSQLPADRRRALLWDLAYHGGQEGIDFALEACRSEPSAEVVQSVLEIFEFGGAESEFYSLLQNASPEVWRRLATRQRLSDAKGEFRARLLEEKKKLAGASSGSDKLHVLLELTEEREYDDPGEIIALALDVKHNDYHAEYATFTPLASSYPEQLSRSIVERLIRGDSVPIFAARFVRVAASEHQESLRAIALGANTRDGRTKEIAARALNEESARSLIQELFAVLDELRANSGPAADPFRQKYQTITSALHLVHHTVLVPSLVASNTNTPRHIAALAELTFRWRSEERDDEALPTDESDFDSLSSSVERWVDLILGHADTTRDELSQVATAIKRAAAPRLLPPLKRLLDADLDRWSQERTELERLRKERQPTTRANMSYTPIYRQAIEAFEGEAVRDLLLTYVGNPDFEVEAAFALRQYGTSDRIPSAAEGIGRPKYERVVPGRDRRSRERRPISAVAAVVIDRVETLVKTGHPQDLMRAVGLATAAAQMDYGDRIADIKAVLLVPGPISPRYGLLHVLVFTGESLPSTCVQQGFDEALAKYVEQKWHANNEWWVIERWIELMAFSDAPESIIDCVARLPAELKQVHNFDRIIFALGYIDPTQSIKTLTALAGQIPGLTAAHDYTNAFAQIGTPEAARQLLALACDPGVDASRRHDWFSFANALISLVRKHPDVRQEILTRAAADQRLASLPVIARILPSVVEQGDVLMLLQAWNPHGNDPSSHILEQAVHDLAVEDRPIEGSNAIEREPADLSILRSELFRIYAKGEPCAALTARLLRIIDRQRDEYGRPLAEPRHPNLALGVAWPTQAADLLQLSEADDHAAQA